MLLQLFKEKVPGTDELLISPELIGYLKWLIYVAAYGDRTLVSHAEFYAKDVAFLRDPGYKLWRSFLYTELDEWYSKRPPSSKKSKSNGRAVAIASVVVDRRFRNVDNFVDPLEAGVAATAAALAAADAAAGAAGAGAPGGT
jgi:hypothetical protein